MANRPRRPRTGSTPPTQADPSAENGAEAEFARSESDGADGVPPEPASEAMSEPVADAAPGAESPASPGLPPLADQPRPSEDSTRQQRAGEDWRTENASPAVDAGEAAPAPAGEEAPRRHLGEFEDDETLSPADADRSHPIGVTDAYGQDAERAHAAGEAAPAQAKGSSFGSLFGAALAGAALTLLGGSLLVYAGLLPGTGPATAPNQFASAGDLETVSSEVETLRGSVEQLQSADAAGGSGTFASESDLAALADRLAALEAATTAPDIEALETAQATATGAQDAAGAAQSAADEAGSAAQDAQSAAAQAQTLAGDNASRIDDFEARIAAIESAQAQSRIALAAAGLKAALDRGDPFEPELDTFEAAGGSAEAVEPLRALAASGVPTPVELAAEWTSVEADIRRAIVQPDASAGVGDQLLAGLSSLVTVRSTGDEAAQGSEPEAVLSRMSAAMAAGDLSTWLEERGGLEAPAQAASADFAERVEARLRATQIVDTALGEASDAPMPNEG